MRLYIQQLEERVRQLTGENERLLLRAEPAARLARPAAAARPTRSRPARVPARSRPQTGVQVGANVPAGAPPQDLGTLSVVAERSADRARRRSPTTERAGRPFDVWQAAWPASLSAPAPAYGTAACRAILLCRRRGLPAAPSPTTALSGSPRDEYDLAYGYILTGDYGLAEETFKSWLAVFPSDPQAPDAQFWLGESHLQQGEYRDAANAFLPSTRPRRTASKVPTALLKLGVSLSALGEKNAACGTFAELGRRYPQASESLMSRVRDEESRAGC